MLSMFSRTDKTSEKNEVTVYVWSGGFLKGLGHVAIDLGKTNTYCSIWPSRFPATPMNAIFPLYAAPLDAGSLQSDCKREGHTPGSSELAELTGEPRPAPIPQAPDKVFRIKGLNPEKMQEELARLNDKTMTGNLCYQLLPGVKLFGKSEVFNCVTLTERLLTAGGMQELPKTAAWMTPTAFGNLLNRHPQASQITPPSESLNGATFKNN